jgi:integrase
MWKDRPGMARLFLSTSSAMFGWAEKRRLLAHNPVKGLTRPKSGEHTQWPDTAIDYALKNAPEHIRLACLIGLTTSQRIGDICNAKMVDIIDGVWHIKQSKTGTSLRIPLTEEVLSEIAKHKSVWMLGKKWRSEYLSSVVANGLRKAAASKMAESGCTVEELAAITGHKSLAVVAHYIKAADQAKLARRAMEKTYG